MAGTRDLEPKRRPLCETADIPVASPILVLGKIGALHQTHICAARKRHLDDLATLPVSEVVVDELHYFTASW
jgi:hypothetical protein